MDVLNLGVFILAPIGVLMIFVFATVYAPLYDVLAGSLSSSSNGGTVITLIGLVTLILSAGLIFGIYKGLIERDRQEAYYQ